MFINDIIDHTLKKRDITDGGKLKWSRTSLTMLSAWLVVLWSYIHYTLKDGFNEPAFYALIGVALGAKVTDAWAKKMNPDKPDNPPTP